MPDLRACLQTAIDAGEVDRRRAEAAQAKYDRLVAENMRFMPRAAAEAAAAADLKDATRRATAEARHASLQQLTSMRRNAVFLQKDENPHLALTSLLFHGEGRGHGVQGVEARQKGIRRQFQGMMREASKAFGRDLAGRARNPTLLKDVVRERHGKVTGNANAAIVAKAIGETFEYARQMFNAHGGHIGELADWGLPHSHDAGRIRAPGQVSPDRFDKELAFAPWRAKIEPLLDWTRIVDPSTDKPFASGPGVRPNAARTEDWLRGVFETITSEGWNGRAPSSRAGGAALYNRRADHRSLHFRDGDAWLAYNETYGQADPWATMQRHLDGMARDIALMQVLGPNPNTGLEHAIQTVKQRAYTTGGDRQIKRANKAEARARAVLAHLNGAANDPVDTFWAKFFGGVRGVLTSAQLGSALLSSVTDNWTHYMAARSVGMSRGQAARGVLRTYELIANAQTRETAERMGYVADTLADVGSSTARYLMDGFAPEWAERLASFTLRASGLSHLTDMHRAAFLMEFSGLLGDNAGRSLDRVDAPLQKLLRDRGITDDDWALMSDPELLFRPREGGPGFLAPTYLREAALVAGDNSAAQIAELATRLSAIMEEQLEFAVPTNRVEARSAAVDFARPGTFVGELLRSVTMYKSFGLSVMISNWRRTQAQGTLGAKAAYFASMTAGLTVLGGVAVQLKEIARGRDPRPMDTPAFWAAAMFQGGGFGIFGDFVSASTNRFGGSLQTSLAGPVVGFGADLGRVIGSNITRAAQGEDTSFYRDAVRFGARTFPGQTWQFRTAAERLVWDQLQGWLDPDAEAQFRRQQRRAERDYGVGFWWAPGETAPSRAPDLANAAGGNRR